MNPDAIELALNQYFEVLTIIELRLVASVGSNLTNNISYLGGLAASVASVLWFYLSKVKSR